MKEIKRKKAMEAGEEERIFGGRLFEDGLMDSNKCETACSQPFFVFS